MNVVVAPSGDFSVYTLTLLTSPTPRRNRRPRLVSTRRRPRRTSSSTSTAPATSTAADDRGVPAGRRDPAADQLPGQGLPRLRSGDARPALAAGAAVARSATRRTSASSSSRCWPTSADQLSYRQDVIATEAYLGTARLRTSARRHARLVDYTDRRGRQRPGLAPASCSAPRPDGIMLPAGTRCATLFPGANAPFLDA